MMITYSLVFMGIYFVIGGCAVQREKSTDTQQHHFPKRNAQNKKLNHVLSKKEVFHFNKHRAPETEV